MSLTGVQLQAALLDEMIAPHDGGFSDVDLPRLVGQFNGAPPSHFFGPTRPGRAMTSPEATPVANRLMRYYGTVTEGVNVYLLNDGTATLIQPADLGDVRRVLWGGHDEPVTPAESVALTAAGLGAYLRSAD